MLVINGTSLPILLAVINRIIIRPGKTSAMMAIVHLLEFRV